MGEVPREVRAPFEIQVHREESNVAGYIHVPKAIVKFDAVVDVERARRKVNVLEVQVAMAIANPVLPDPRREQTRVATIKPVSVESKNLIRGGRQCGWGQRSSRVPDFFLRALSSRNLGR